MTDHDTQPGSTDHHDDDPIEAYCVRCKDMVEMEEPQAVWTRKGSPGTRGFCPICGTTVFRMGRTDAHQNLKQPRAIKVADGATSKRQSRPTKAIPATYINYADTDAVLAHQLADDLGNMGVHTWVPRAENGEIAWASGVNPALEDCTQMLVILSPAALQAAHVQEAWAFFRQHRKKIVVAQKADVEVPDDLRRAPRVSLADAYRSALRELVQALAE